MTLIAIVCALFVFVLAGWRKKNGNRTVRSAPVFLKDC